MLDQPFGKDLQHSPSFLSEACLRHVLLPLHHSCFLTAADWTILEQATVYAALLSQLLREYGNVDFRPLQGFPVGWQDETEINRDRLRMTTAALLHWDGDLATVVRWIGGPHVGAHRDPHATLAFIRGIVDADICDELERIWFQGVPKVCNASASEANFQAFRQYGNHSSAAENPEIAHKVVVKESRRGYALTMDPRILFFILNAHLTPQGIVDLDKLFKNPRSIFDSSFRPFPWCFAINDWTHKTNEPIIVFPTAFMEFLIHLYNLRITHPHQELYLADDDGQGAFRHNKYHPNVVAMHCFLLLGVLFAMTGTTFGDNTSPGNWEPIARARKQLAQYFYSQPDTVARAAPYLPTIELAPPPTKAEIATFQRADRDSLNRGVIDANGQRRPPTFSHHVDDNLYADIDINMLPAVSSSALSLYTLLGFPTDRTPNALSLDKLNTYYTHQRKLVGLHVDSRTMTVGLLEYKRDETLTKLAEWLKRDKYSIREAAEIHGTLESVTRYTRWGRALFFTLQNVFRKALEQQYHRIKRFYNREHQSDKIARDLPEQLMDRLSHLVAQVHGQVTLEHSRRSPCVGSASVRTPGNL